MNRKFAVVDGSNIATEGRSTPSLAQLDQAVRQFQEQFPDKQVIVVVDATFGHRIDESERAAFDEAVANGEVVSPPAGAIGRGDAFLLRVAERVQGQVLSNDSFQEFHGEHPWLFEEDVLIGGTPVPGVGWIFTPRTPVRGPRSRAARAAAESFPKSVGVSGGAAAPDASKKAPVAKAAKPLKTAKSAKPVKAAQAGGART
ncbi:MAG: NYN domain-containing protein, partial [Acidimicrobiales bacterium]